MNFLALISTPRRGAAPAAPIADNPPPPQPLLDDARPALRSCGWFDSSWELQQGLAVAELPDAELPVAALWFVELPRADRAALEQALAGLMPVLPAVDSAWLQ